MVSSWCWDQEECGEDNQKGGSSENVVELSNEVAEQGASEVWTGGAKLGY